MKKYFYLVLVIGIVFPVLSIFFIPKTFVFAADPIPNITSISPSSPKQGDEVEVTGTDFLDLDNTRCAPFAVCEIVFLSGDSDTLGQPGWTGQEQQTITWTPTKIRFKLNAYNTNSVKVNLRIRTVGPRGPFDSNSFPITVLPGCVADTFHCEDFGQCQPNGTKTRNCVKTFDCPNADTPLPDIIAQCIYVPPACSTDTWSCGDWNVCSVYGSQTRSCIKTFDCPTAYTPSPTTSQNCVPPQPACNADTWSCGDWGICSPQGIQNRSCNKTFDCSSVETASPATSQYCVAPNQPKQQSPTEELGIVNQDSIIKSTVKLVCPVDKTMASQGSGTVIGSSGTILTNKHVVDGTQGCLVGFIDNYGDEPYFGDRQIADIYRVSSDADVAILKLRNPANKNLTFIDISKGNSNQLGLGDKITTYGYPAKFGTKITYTSGDFSGVDGNYLKTTAIIEHGNSGGGAYLKNGTFIGIPSAVVKGSLNSMGYLLSVNKVNNWINGSSYAYDSGNNNNYSRVSSVLENIDLNKLDSLNLYTESNSVNIPDGALIRATGDPDVFIVKYIGAKKFKRLVLSPAVFNNYGHLKWENVMVIDKATVDSFITSDLVRAVGDKKVYRLFASGDTGQKRWVKTSAAFAKFGLDWDSIYEINNFDRDSYVAGAVLE